MKLPDTRQGLSGSGLFFMKVLEAVPERQWGGTVEPIIEFHTAKMVVGV